MIKWNTKRRKERHRDTEIEMKDLTRGVRTTRPHPGKRSQRGSQRMKGWGAEKQMGRRRRGAMDGKETWGFQEESARSWCRKLDFIRIHGGMMATSIPPLPFRHIAFWFLSPRSARYISRWYICSTSVYLCCKSLGSSLNYSCLSCLYLKGF